MERRIASKAASLLLSQNRHKLPVDPFGLNFNYQIRIDSLENYARNTATTLEELSDFYDLADGITLKKGDLFVVLLNNKNSLQRQRFTLAHELGHVYLNHENDECLQELAANMFAAELLTPRVLFREVQNRFETENNLVLRKIFDVSEHMVNRRIRNLNEDFLPTEEEKRLLKLYKPFLPKPNMPIITV